jgi:hypothetical protein
MFIANRLIRALDRMDERIAQVPEGSERHKELQRIRALMCRKFALRLWNLTAGEDFYDPDPNNKYDVKGRDILPGYKVTGTPSKKGRPGAAEWMRERDKTWDGSAKALRREVTYVLNRGGNIPSSFGLGIQLTVEIRAPTSGINSNVTSTLTDFSSGVS